MGGGKTNSTAANTQEDNDIMAQDNAVVIGDGSEFSSMDGNEGVIIGDGSAYTITTMDDNTVRLLEDAGGLVDNAMTLMYANTENVLENYAAQIGIIDEPEFMNPTTTPAVQSRAATGNSKVIFGGVGLLLLAAVALSRRNAHAK